MKNKKISQFAGFFCMILALSAPLGSQTQQPAASSLNIALPESAPATVNTSKGSVTGLKIPRFVTLKSNKANVRRGPSLSHRIDWVFKQHGYPLEVIAEYGHWRRVRDYDGAAGWVHYSLISGLRMGFIQDDATLHTSRNADAHIVANVEKNALLRLHECTEKWCRASAEGHKGWLQKELIWGVYEAETWD